MRFYDVHRPMNVGVIGERDAQDGAPGRDATIVNVRIAGVLRRITGPGTFLAQQPGPEATTGTLLRGWISGGGGRIGRVAGPRSFLVRGVPAYCRGRNARLLQFTFGCRSGSVTIKYRYYVFRHLLLLLTGNETNHHLARMEGSAPGARGCVQLSAAGAARIPCQRCRLHSLFSAGRKESAATPSAGVGGNRASIGQSPVPVVVMQIRQEEARTVSAAAAEGYDGPPRATGWRAYAFWPRTSNRSR